MATPVLPTLHAQSGQSGTSVFPGLSGEAAGKEKAPFNQILGQQARGNDSAVPSFDKLQAVALSKLGGGLDREAPRGGAEAELSSGADAETAVKDDGILPAGGNFLPLEQGGAMSFGFHVGASQPAGISELTAELATARHGSGFGGQLFQQNPLQQQSQLREATLFVANQADAVNSPAAEFSTTTGLNGIGSDKNNFLTAALAAVNGGGKSLAALRGQAAENLNDQRSLDSLDVPRLAMSRISATTAERASPPQFSVLQNALTDPAWGQAMTARLGWMAGSGVHNASLRLHPEELGGVNVQINLSGDRASVQFQTQNAETSELIEKLMPRLASAFESQGMKLDDAKVSHQASWGEQQQSAMADQGQGSRDSRSGETVDRRVGDDGDLAADNAVEREIALELVKPSGVDAFA